MTAGLDVAPCTLKEANAFVRAHHRHHGAVRGLRWAIALVTSSDEIVGVAIAGRTTARGLHGRRSLEVTRLCVDGLTRNACSRLYGAVVRAGRAMGYRRFITYTLKSESGASLRAAGWRPVATVRGRSWDTPSRRRGDVSPVAPKVRWEIAA